MRHGQRQSGADRAQNTNREAPEHTSTDLKAGQTKAKSRAVRRDREWRVQNGRTKIRQLGVTSFVSFSGECCPAVDEVRSVKTATTGPVQVG
jgi:hypothetical protein